MAHHQAQQQAPRLSFVVREVNMRRGERELISFDRKSLVGEIVNARAYSAANGGDLPHTPLLDAAVRVFRQDPQLFAMLHRCPALLRLLRGDGIHDAQTPGAPVEEVIPTDPVVAPPVIGNQLVDTPSPPTTLIGGTNPPTTLAVPEPSTMLMLPLALVLVLAFRMFGRGRKSPVAIALA